MPTSRGCASGPCWPSACGIAWSGARRRTSARYWGSDARGRLGWQPQDSADGWADRVGNLVAEDPVERRYQGGAYPAMEYSRSNPAPAKPFDV